MTQYINIKNILDATNISLVCLMMKIYFLVMKDKNFAV